jgi:hypothetical protein
MTRSSFLTAVAILRALLVAPNSRATDLSDLLQKFEIPTEPGNWGGFYLGVNNGAGFTNFDESKHATKVDLVEQFYDIVGEFGEGEVGFRDLSHSWP